jgi:hydrogenase-4 component E
MPVLLQQSVSVAAALVLLTSFALLAQRRILTLLRWFALQGVVLAATSALVAYVADVPELYLSAVLTLLLKGIALPWLLWRNVVNLGVHREVEPLVNIFLTVLIGAALVLFAFYVTLPIAKLSQLITRNTLAIATACVLIGMLMMITRRQAITQVVGFLAIENALFFTATAATYGMPMVVELGVAFDVLIAALVFGLFFFHIRATFETLDVGRMEEDER